MIRVGTLLRRSLDSYTVVVIDVREKVRDELLTCADLWSDTCSFYWKVDDAFAPDPFLYFKRTRPCPLCQDPAHWGDDITRGFFTATFELWSRDHSE